MSASHQFSTTESRGLTSELAEDCAGSCSIIAKGPEHHKGKLLVIIRAIYEAGLSRSQGLVRGLEPGVGGGQWGQWRGGGGADGGWRGVEGVGGGWRGVGFLSQTVPKTKTFRATGLPDDSE